MEIGVSWLQRIGGFIVMDTARPENHLTPMETLLGAWEVHGVRCGFHHGKEKTTAASYRIEITEKP
jgi:hypothetical protein